MNEREGEREREREREMAHEVYPIFSTSPANVLGTREAFLFLLLLFFLNLLRK